jgi:hypothetical protein
MKITKLKWPKNQTTKLCDEQNILHIQIWVMSGLGSLFSSFLIAILHHDLRNNFWPQFYIAVLIIALFFSIRSFTFSNFSLDFYFPFSLWTLIQPRSHFGFLQKKFLRHFFPYSFWTFWSLFYLDFHFCSISFLF